MKIELSYRRASISGDLWRVVDGVRVYNLSELAQMKASAYLSRDKIRDLYDISFICTERFDEIDAAARSSLRRALEYKDLEQFDYLLRTQKDQLIDTDLLEDRFLRAFEMLDLLGASEPDAAASLSGDVRDAREAATAGAPAGKLCRCAEEIR